MKKYVALAFTMIISIAPISALSANAQLRPEVERWKKTALAAGWPSHSWPKLRCIIWRESGGNPKVVSRTKDVGLMQIHYPLHLPWLRKAGIASSVSDLKYPYINLVAARALWKKQGWQAWHSDRRPC